MKRSWFIVDLFQLLADETNEKHLARREGQTKTVTFIVLIARFGSLACSLTSASTLMLFFLSLSVS